MSLPQSLTFMRPKHLPRYGDDAILFEQGAKYIYRKKEAAAEPPASARALRKFDSLGDALQWCRSNLSPDTFQIVSI